MFDQDPVVCGLIPPEHPHNEFGDTADFRKIPLHEAAQSLLERWLERE